MSTQIELTGTARRAPSPTATATHRILRAPLVIKLAGANALVVVAAWIASYVAHRRLASDWQMLAVLAVALLVGLAVNLVLVSVALRPIRDLERTATRVWAGDLDSRVPRSAIADAELEQVGGTLNFLLTSLAQDRAHIRKLASELVRSGDRERSRVGKELHDSVAQSLAALRYQLLAIERDVTDPALVERIGGVRNSAGELLEEVRLLSHTVHPQILDDLGLVPALRHLARTSTGETIVRVVETGDPAAISRVSRDATAALYRVAQESVANALRHGAPGTIELRIGETDGAVVLQVDDDGRGFDLAGMEKNVEAMGLFAMRERMALVDGTFDITSEPQNGTCIRAGVPLKTNAASLDAPVKLETNNAR